MPLAPAIGESHRASEIVRRHYHRAARLAGMVALDPAVVEQDRAQGVACIGYEVVVDDRVDPSGLEQSSILGIEVVSDIGKHGARRIVEGLQDAAIAAAHAVDGDDVAPLLQALRHLEPRLAINSKGAADLDHGELREALAHQRAEADLAL